MNSVGSRYQPRVTEVFLLTLLLLLSRSAFGAAAPGIATQPQNQITPAGSNAVFSVVASGQMPLLYQWSFNGTNLANGLHIGGATSMTLTISNVTGADSGNYQVVVSSSHGSVTSSNAVLTVVFPPSIVAQPTNQTIYAGQSAMFSVTASGTAPLSYQWTFNGTNLAGQTTSVLSIASATTNQTGNYVVVVTNPYGAEQSSNATLVVLADEPAITAQPQSQSALAGATAVFTVSARGAPPLGYQWSFNGTALTDGPRLQGSTSATLTVSNLICSDAGIYQVTVSNSYSSAVSSNAVLTVLFTNHTHYVNLNSSDPLPPYGDWSTAATSIQDAINVASPNEQIIVTNGTYQAGNTVAGGANNRVAAIIPLSITSVSGPAQTIIDGGGAVRCVYLTNDAALSGFTLTNGNNSGNGAGAYCESASAIITNCLLISNNSGGYGGGTYQGMIFDSTFSANSGVSGSAGMSCYLSNCVLTGNSSVYGAAAYSTLDDCTVISNALATFPSYATFGGGAYSCTLNNCSLTGNVCSQSGGAGIYCTMSNCTLIANSAQNYQGGGVDSSTLYSCTLSNNIAGQWGGNVSESTLENCTLAGGAAYTGGGAKSSTLNDCMLVNNSANFGQGGGANSCTLSNCVLLGNSAGYTGGGAEGSTLLNCLILSNAAPYGGGVNGGILTNCVLNGNVANDPYVGGGGGANGGSLYNCLLWGNSSVLSSGGAASSTLINCTVAANSANVDGGGVTSSSLTNCIVYYNTSALSGNYSGTNFMSWCCTTPLPTANLGDAVIGTHNFSSPPLFADLAHGNFRLYPGSPCIDSGNTAVAPVAVDLDGNQRVVNSIVDLGAYEFQNSPFIEIQPTNQTAPFGQPSLAFSVVAVGPGPLTYQWLFNGTNIAGATNSTLTLNFLQYSQAGNYSVLVVNSYGSLLSSNAVLTVVAPTPPAFVSSPADQTVATGTNVTLSVLASGAPAPTYQWYFSGLALTDNSHYTGTSSSSLLITAVQTNDSGAYWAVASNVGGSATSAVANLSVIMAPSIVQQPQNLTVLAGATAMFSAAAAGTAPFGYQWFFNGAPLSDDSHITGSATAQLSVLNAQFADSGNYMVVITNLVGTVSSTGAVLTVMAPPQISQQPSDQNVLLSSNAVFSAAAVGTQPISYQWFFNSAPLSDNGRISGSATASLTIGSTQTNDAGVYSVVASNAYGAATSSVANLTVWLPVGITQQPSNQTVAVGASPALTVAAAGTEPFGYQWYFNNSPLTDNSRISGSATAGLSISNAQTSDSGPYFAVVTNLLSSATSAVATLSVLVPPSITTQPLGRSTPLGMSNLFTAGASGAAPLSYQWVLNGANILGATNSSYSIAAVGTNDLGVYQLAVSNTVGVALSSNALLTVGPVVAWGYNANNQCIVPPGLSNVTSLGAGYSYSLASRLDGTIAGWGSVNANTNSGFTNVLGVSATVGGALALRSDGTVAGSGSVNPAIFKAFPSNIVSVAAGYNFGLGLREEGTVVGWGEYSGTTYAPVAVPAGLTKVVAISAGYQHSLALRSDGTVVAFGVGVATNVPIGLSNVVAIAAGMMNSLALKADGTLVAWGSGAGTNIPAGLSNVMAIAAGGYTDQRTSVGFAVQSNGTLVAWGASAYSQTNLPSGLSNVVFVADGAYHTLALVNDGRPQILRQPVGATAWSGRDWTLQVTAAGAAPLSYQWFFNGTNLAGATNTTLLLPAIQSTNAGNYQVVVSNSLGVATSFPVPITVMDSPPFVLAQPGTNISAYLGSRTALPTAIAGSGPLQYQWRFNGQDIPGANGDTLNFDRVHMTNAGVYALFVSNSFGAITSAAVNLTVQQVVVWGNPANGVTNMPPGLTNAAAISADYYGNIVLRADGTVAVWGNLGYVSTNTSGISNVVEVSAGYNSYLALKSNGHPYLWGGISPGLSNLVFAQSNILSGTFSPNNNGCALLRADGTVLEVSPVNVTTNSTITNAIALEGSYNGYLVLRADGTIYAPTSYFPPNVFTNVSSMASAIGSSSGQTVALKRDGKVREYPITLLPGSLSNVIAVAAASASQLDFAVLQDGSVTWGSASGSFNLATNVPYGLSHVQVLDAGYSHCLALLSDRDFPPVLLNTALNTANYVVSSKGSPQWFGQTNISHDGASAAQSAPIGNNLSSSMRMWVVGPINVSFWWKVSSETNHDYLSFSAGGVVLTNISGEVDWQQCTVSVPPGNQILQLTYSKDASGSAGQDAAWVDQLQLIPQAPTILTQPVSQDVVGPTNVVLSVLATGTPPLIYRWWNDAGFVPGGISGSLSIPNAVRANSGNYRVRVSNSAGAVTSSNALLSVHVPQLLSAPAPQPDGSILLSSSDAGGGLLSSSDLTNLEAQASTNLVDWVTLTNALILTNGVIQLQDPAAVNSPDRFYRIIELR